MEPGGVEPVTESINKEEYVGSRVVGREIDVTVCLTPALGRGVLNGMKATTKDDFRRLSCARIKTRA